MPFAAKGMGHVSFLIGRVAAVGLSEKRVRRTRLRGGQTTTYFEVCSESATTLSACAKASGNSFPLASARRRIPAQALGDKK